MTGHSLLLGQQMRFREVASFCPNRRYIITSPPCEKKAPYYRWRMEAFHIGTLWGGNAAIENTRPASPPVHNKGGGGRGKAIHLPNKNVEAGASGRLNHIKLGMEGILIPFKASPQSLPIAAEEIFRDTTRTAYF